MSASVKRFEASSGEMAGTHKCAVGAAHKFRADR